MRETKNSTSYSWLGKQKNIYSQEDIVYSPFLYGIKRLANLYISPKEEIRLIPYFSQYIFIVVNKGKLIFKQDDFQIELNEGECLLREGGQETNWTCKGNEKVECYYFLLTGNDISLFYSEYERQNGLGFPFSEQIKKIVDELFEEVKKHNVNKKAVSTLIYSLLLEIINPTQINKNKITQKALDYIEKQYQSDELSVQDLANSLHISYHYFCHLFKQENLVSPQKYITKYRLNKALQLLASGHLSIEDICVNVGFKNKHSFIKECKKETGLKPFAYRKANNNTPLVAKQTKKILFTNVSNIGDPFIFVENKKYYMFTTARNGDNIYCYMSEDMKYYEFIGPSLDKTQSFGKLDFWAAKIIKYNDEYFMFYSARAENNIIHINVAKSKDITGPYKDININKPLINLKKSTINAHPFVDKDGRIYLFFVLDSTTNVIKDEHISEICVTELKPDFSGTIGEIHKVLSPTETWEKVSPNKYYRVESPAVIFQDGTYFLTYSANNFRDINYCAGIAKSDSILGPYTKKKDGPIAKRVEGVISGPGHFSYFYDLKGNLKCVYHILSNINRNTSDRRACISSVYIDNNELAIDYL